MFSRFFQVLKVRFQSSTGAAFAEASIVLPIIAALLFGIVYISTYMQSHALITNIANEGARYMSRQIGLATGPALITELADLEESTVPTGTGVGHETHRHVINFLRAMKRRDRNFDIHTIRITTTYSDVEDTVRVQVSASVQKQSFIPSALLERVGWNGLRVGAQSVQPYLY